MNGGVVNRTKLRPGSRLQFYCNRGYRLVGSSNATCRLYPNGLFQWDAPPPFCQGKKKLNTLYNLRDDGKSWQALKSCTLRRIPPTTHFSLWQLSHVESLSLRATAASMLTSTLLVARSPITVTTVTTLTLVFHWQQCVWRMAAGVMLPQPPDVYVSIFKLFKSRQEYELTERKKTSSSVDQEFLWLSCCLCRIVELQAQRVWLILYIISLHNVYFSVLNTSL